MSMIDWPECRRPETMMAIRFSDPERADDWS
jgi:hypothetical protein